MWLGPLRGYRFIAPVEPYDGSAVLLPESSITIAPANGQAVVHPPLAKLTELESAVAHITYTRRLWRFLIVPILLAVVAMIVLLRGRHAHVDSASPIPEPVILPLVSLQGEQSMPAFSPDGSRVAFMWRAPNQAQC